MPRRSTQPSKPTAEPAEPAAGQGESVITLRPFEQGPFLPLHFQVRNDLSLQLRSGRFGAGAALPSEGDLCQHYGVSRGTMRHALLELAREGIIERFAGRGSFLRQPKFEGHIAASYRQFRLEGPPIDPGGRILSLSRHRATAEIADRLGLKPSAFVWSLDRVRFVGASPVAIQMSAIPADLCQELTKEELTTRHLIDVLRDRHGIEFTHADEYVDPGIADAFVATHLEVAPGTPVYELERKTYLADGRVGEYRRAVMRGDTHRYKIELR
ncbi:GntR family transcriptional regulator [Bosea sp. LjRoot90]|uniref:GntR family transcriptional regulator n=1 Tax=Bosea sp. LjRoot90 TaxID=3342342 RepID=UPI003ECE6FC5